MKTCITCKTEKDERQFYRQSHGNKVLQTECMPCKRERARKRYYDVVRPRINKGLRNYRKEGTNGSANACA